MAHSIEVVGGQHEIFRDFDLLVLVKLMLAELCAHGDRYAPISEFRVTCETQLEVSGPGTLDLNLSELLRNQARIRAFEQLLDSVEATVRRFGQVIPLSELKSLPAAAGVSHRGDYPCNRLTAALDQLGNLLRAAQANY